MGFLQKGNSLNYPSFFYLGFCLVFLNVPVCQSSFWSCAFGIWSNRGIHVIFIFLLSISLNGWNLRALFYLKHSPSCTFSLFKYNWGNQVIRGSPEMCEAELDYFVWRIKKSNKAITSKWNICISKSGLAGDGFTPLSCRKLQAALSCAILSSSLPSCANIYLIALKSWGRIAEISYHVLYRKPEVLLP